MSTPELWDSRYAAVEYAYGTTPNAGLVALEYLLPRSARVLVPGDGEGRNGVWLATRGHQVSVVDQSAEGLRKCAQLAGSRGVSVETVLDDPAPSRDEELPPNRRLPVVKDDPESSSRGNLRRHQPGRTAANHRKLTQCGRV